MTRQWSAQIGASVALALLLTFGPSTVVAQEPPCVTIPETGRTCIDVMLADPRVGGLGRTGSSVFQSDNEPGNDSGPYNHVIRTLDLLHYELRFRVLHDSAADLRIQASLPANLDFADAANPDFGGARIPEWCGAGSSITGQFLDCALGSVAAGVTRNVVLLTQPRFGIADGSILRLDVRASATNQQSTGAVVRVGYQDPLTANSIDCTETRNGQPVLMQPCGDVVSAAPRFDLEFSGYASTNLLDRGARGPQINRRALSSSLTTVVGGAAGRAGFVVAYPIAMALPGDGVGGAPVNHTDPIILTERLRNSDGLTGFGELVGCGLNGNRDPIPAGSLMPADWALGETQASALKAIYHPYGRSDFVGADADNAITDSGTLTCTQSIAGGDITLSIVPGATSFSTTDFPTRQVDGQVVPRRYVFVGLVTVFYPAVPVLAPADGGTGDGSVTVRHDVGVLNGNTLQALSIQGIAEPDGAAINDGFGSVQTFDDDNNNFSIATLDSSGTQFRKHWRNPRRDNAMVQNELCLKDATDPACRHGHVFPGANIQSDFFFDNATFSAHPNAQFCDEWDVARTRLRLPFDSAANTFEFPADMVMYLELGGANASPDVLADANIRIEVSTDAGTVPNIDWDSVEPARTDSRSQLSAPECSSGSWVAATLPATLTNGIHEITFPGALEIPSGSGRYPTIRRVRLVMDELPPFVQFALRGSYEVVATQPRQRLPNRTSFRLDGTGPWTYAENDHAIVRVADTNITMTANANLTTGEPGPLTRIGFGEVFETTIQSTFTSGESAPGPATTPLIIKSYLPSTLELITSSPNPALSVPPYPGTNPENGQPSTVLEWRVPNPVPGNPVPTLRYNAQLAVSAANGATIHSVATIEHELDPGPLFVEPVFASLEDRLALQDLSAVVPIGLLVTKSTTTPFIELDGAMTWTLRAANTSGAAYSTLRLIDVLPSNGDVVNTENLFNGALQGGSITANSGGSPQMYYTTSPRGDVNRNPNCVSNGGSLPDGTGPCPASGAAWTIATAGVFPAGTTAIRIDDLDGLAPNSLQTWDLVIHTDDNRPGDRYENSVVAVAPNESLVVASAKVQVQVPAAELRGVVYADMDQSGAPNIGDLGIGAVALELSGTDVLGNTMIVRSDTVSGAQALSTVNRLTLNGGPETVYVCPSVLRITRGGYLFCRLPTANAAGYTITETQPVDYADRLDRVGGLRNGGNPGVAGNDVLSGIRVRNDLVTGAGDVGTNYDFGEFPLFADVGGRVYLEGSVPPNLWDDDEDEDPPLMTDLQLVCTPAYTGNSIEPTNSDGRYRFTRVPVGALCAIQQTQPLGYFNAYNTPGQGGLDESGGQPGSRMNSQIRVIVPAGGSFGNNFAETFAMVGVPPQPVPVSPRTIFLIALLVIVLGGMRIRER